MHDLYVTRLQYAVNIADALEYLHRKRILYRDLKPANIGFDQEGNIKLFDFGLAVELPMSEECDGENATFPLSSNTGTSKYMAPEVIRKEPYNAKADVYSFSILLWELMALERPYAGLTGDQAKQRVAIFGERPNIARSWPTQLRRLLLRGWCDSIEDRVSIADAKKVLIHLMMKGTGPRTMLS